MGAGAPAGEERRSEGSCWGMMHDDVMIYRGVVRAVGDGDNTSSGPGLLCPAAALPCRGVAWRGVA